MKTTLLFFLVLVAATCRAQQELQKIIDNQTPLILADMKMDDHGNIFCAFNDAPSGYYDNRIPGIMKLDTSLNILWALDELFDDVVSVGSCLPMADKGVVTIGIGYDTSFFSHGFITRLDSSGNIIWGRKTHSDNATEILSDAIALPSGNLLVCGLEPAGAFIMKLNGSGDILWKEKISVPNSSSIWANSIISANDGNYYLAGQVTDSYSQTGGMVMKIDSNGEIFWVNHFADGQQYPFIPSIVAGSDSSYYFTLDDFIHDTIAVVKANSNVSIPFAPAYYHPHSKQFYRSVSLDANENIIVCGTEIDSLNLDDGFDVTMLTFSMDGFLTSSHRFDAGRNEFVTSTCVLQNILYIAGNSFTSNFDSGFVYLVKQPITSSVGCNEFDFSLIGPPFSFVSMQALPFMTASTSVTLDAVEVAGTYINPVSMDLCNQTIVESIPAHDLFSVFPNPFSESTTIQNFTNEKATLKIIDEMGKIIFQSAMGPSEKISFGEEFTGGIYFVHLNTVSSIFSSCVVKVK